MADVTVEMETGHFTVRSDESPRPENTRGYRFASEEAKEELRRADKAKREAAVERPAWKDATPEQRREARALVDAVSVAKSRVRREDAEGVIREREKREAASARERLMSME